MYCYRIIVFSIIMITFLVSCNNNRNNIVIENFHSLDSIYYQQNILSKKSYLVNGYDNT